MNTDASPEPTAKSDSEQGRKDDDGKLRFDLFPVRPLEAVAYVFTMGAKKYADRNWEKGLLWGRVFAAMMRHAWAWWRGERNDPEDGQHHLASVAWCALVLMEYEDTCPCLDDRSANDRFVLDRPSQRKVEYTGSSGQAPGIGRQPVQEVCREFNQYRKEG